MENFGYVVGRFVRKTVHEGETISQKGAVFMDPTRTTHFEHDDGYVTATDTTETLRLTEGSIRGTWLAVGYYTVRTQFAGDTDPWEFTVEVTSNHTKTNPLDLTLASPEDIPPEAVEVVRVSDRIRAEAAAEAAETAASEANTSATNAHNHADTARDYLSDAHDVLGEIKQQLIVSSDTEPTDPQDGTVWFDTSNYDMHHITHEWAGTPRDSESIKRIDGAEVARNYITNPSFETGSHGVTSNRSYGAEISTFGPAVAVGQQAIYVEFPDGETSTAGIYQSVPIDQGDWGRWLSLSLVARMSSGDFTNPLRLLCEIQSGGSTQDYITLDTATLNSDSNSGQQRRAGAILIPDGTDEVRLWIRAQDSVTGSMLIHTDAWAANIAGTEAEALDQAESYFDGDTENYDVKKSWQTATAKVYVGPTNW